MKKEKIMNVGTCGLICFHLCACGLPMLAALLGFVSPLAGVFSPTLMNVLLGIAGISLAASWIFYFKGCKCDRNLLLFSTILFLGAISLHFIIPITTGVESCH